MPANSDQVTMVASTKEAMRMLRRSVMVGSWCGQGRCR
jgi:hypothetical protein